MSSIFVLVCSFVCVRITLDLRESFISSYALKCARETRKDLFGALFQTGAPLAQRFGTAAEFGELCAFVCSLQAGYLTGQNLLAPADVYRIVPRRTWVRRKAEARLSRDEFDGLYRLVRVQTLAELVFGDAARAKAWLHSPKERLGGTAPMDFAADTLGFEAVQAWLHEIDQGYFA